MGNKSSTAAPVNPELLNSVLHDQGGERLASCLHSRRGNKNVNQDSAVMYQGYGEQDEILCGVFDGHGKYGHFVSRLVKERLPFILLQQKKAVAETRATNDSLSSNMTSYDWETACVNAFEEMDEEIKLVKKFDASFSGSTAVVVIKQGDELIIANLGDSRAILGRKQENELVALQLTIDLKPGTPDEHVRITRSNGRVFALRAEPDLQRAWLPTVFSPGMAMSRAFGDLVMKNYGIISIPVISHHQITSDDLFIVLATDGIWDVLSNEEVTSIVSASETEEMAAKAVVDAAVTAWKVKYPRDKPDDCTAICLFLQNEDLAYTPTSSSPSEDQESHD